MKKPVRKFKETVELQTSPWRRLRSHRFFSVTVLAAAVFSVGCFHVWQRMRVLDLVREVSELRRENAGLVDAHTKVKAEIAALSMAARIQAYAQDSLGLVPAPADHIYTLVPREYDPGSPDELQLMFTAFERVSRHMPVLGVNDALASESKAIRFDSADVSPEGAP